MELNKRKKIFIFIFIYFFIDLSLTQLFLFNFYHKQLEKQLVSVLENRIPNKDYKYTFAKKKTFISKYLGHDYTVSTNNLGFRDFAVRDLDKNKFYTIVIGDSHVEGVPFDYKYTIPGQLNKRLENNNIIDHQFLNAGVASYSSYIYTKKIIKVLDENPWIKTNLVILLLDKSDVSDDLAYFDKPTSFPQKIDTKARFKNRIYDDLEKLYFWNYESLNPGLFFSNLWRFTYRQTTTGILLKKIGDFLELKARNLRDRYVLSKKLKKNFFSISPKQVNSLKTINTRKYLTKYFYGNHWLREGKKSINFSIENLVTLKSYLDNKNIELLVVLYPWAFELVDKIPREKYLRYITPKLKKNNIDYISAYNYFLNLKEDPYTNISDNWVYQDVHLNKKGLKALSDIIWKKVSNKIR